MVQTYKPYWIENTSKLWSKMSFPSANTYDVFVKLASGQTSSLSNTMINGDDAFSDYSTRYTNTGATLSVTDGVLSVSGNGIYYVYDPTAPDYESIMGFSAKLTGGTEYIGYLEPTNTEFIMVADETSDKRFMSKKDGTLSSTTISTVDFTTFQKYEIEKTSADTTLYYNDSILSTKSDNIPDGTPITYAGFRTGPYAQMNINYWYIRQYTKTPPLVSEPTIIDANTLKYTITTYGALTDYQIDFEIPIGFLSSTTESVQVYFDKTPPVITYEAGQLYTSNTEIIQYAEVVDESSLSSVTIQRNSETPITMTKVSGSLNVYGATVPISAGNNYLQITAVDSVGNSATSSTKTVIGVADADNMPVVTLVGTYPSTTTNTSLTVIATVETDDFQYAKIINLSVAGAYAMTATENPTEYSGTVPLVYGDNLIHIEAMGPEGWYGFSETISITNTVVPVDINISFDTDTEYTKQKYYSISTLVSSIYDISSVKAVVNGSDVTLVLTNGVYTAETLLNAGYNSIYIVAENEYGGIETTETKRVYLYDLGTKQLKITNAEGDSVILDGYGPVILGEIQNLNKLTATWQEVKAVGQNGITATNNTLDEQPWIINGLFKANTIDEIRSAKAELYLACNSEISGYAELEYTNEYNEVRTSKCYVEAITQDENRNRSNSLFIPFKISLTRPSPYWLGDMHTLELALALGGLVFPFTLPASFSSRQLTGTIENSGTSEIKPLLKFTGPATTPKITHTESGKYIEINRELTSDEILWIDMDTKKVTIENTATESEINGFKYLTASSRFWTIQRGTNNFTFATGDATQDSQLDIIYYDRYIYL